MNEQDELIARLTGMVRPKRSVESQLGEQFTYDTPGIEPRLSVANAPRGMETKMQAMDAQMGEPAVGAEEAAMAAGAKFNPVLLGASLGIKLLEGQRQMKERERMERYQAQENVKGSLTKSLSRLSQIGTSLGL